MSSRHKKKKAGIAGTFIVTVVRLCSLLPLRAAHALGSFLGILFYYLPNKSKRIARINIQHCFPELDTAAQDKLLKKTLKETGKTFTEMGAMWYWPAEKLQRYIYFDDPDAFEQLYHDKQHAGLLLSPHLGCWEIISIAISGRAPLTSLYRPHRLEKLNRIILNARQRSGATLVPTTNSGVKTLYSKLRQKELIGILPDQDPGEGKGIYAPFFGVSANTMPLAARLISQAKPRVYLTYSIRLEKGRGYKIMLKKAPEKILLATPDEVVRIINELVEDSVRETPEQYQWTYKRFKTRPDGSHFYAEPAK